MHAIGGLYLDIDVECFMPTDKLLSGRDVVLQLEDANPKSLNNAVMASVPGHPFWLQVIQVMMDRGSSANDCFLGFKDLGTILKSTGELHDLALCPCTHCLWQHARKIIVKQVPATSSYVQRMDKHRLQGLCQAKGIPCPRLSFRISVIAKLAHETHTYPALL